MAKFSLISQLDEDANEKERRDPNAPNIEYMRYNLDVYGKEVGVLIPIRECTNFEDAMMDIDTLTNNKLKEAVREFRGLFVRD